ncbi:MAG: hypothetical protein R8J84_04695 [Mariprofundales bacterium]
MLQLVDQINQTATNKSLWNITTPTTTTSITLPTIPTSVTAILANGTTYNLTIMGVEISGSTSTQQSRSR